MSLQQQYWAELLDLEYPEEVLTPPEAEEYLLVDLLADLQEAEDLGVVAALLLGEEDPLEADPREEEYHSYHQAEPLEEGEIAN